MSSRHSGETDLPALQLAQHVLNGEHLECQALLLKHGPELATFRLRHGIYMGQTALHVAVRLRQLELLSYFLSCAGISVDLRDQDGDTSLILATKDKWLEGVLLLIDRGADPMIRGLAGMTASRWAEFFCLAEIARILAEYEVRLLLQGSLTKPAQHARVQQAPATFEYSSDAVPTEVFMASGQA
eukprot:m.916613 g.916613  ORF g.916613 m.916613 type:complete len:185 (+) comp60166_c0_seq1:428-982(+)